MKVIYKYTVELAECQIVEMKRNAKILSAQIQQGQIRLWALCDPDAPKQERKVFVFGTGNRFEDLPPDVYYVDTVQTGLLVWHVFAENY